MRTIIIRTLSAVKRTIVIQTFSAVKRTIVIQTLSAVERLHRLLYRRDTHAEIPYDDAPLVVLWAILGPAIRDAYLRPEYRIHIDVPLRPYLEVRSVGHILEMPLQRR